MDFKDTTKEAEFRKKSHDWLAVNAPKKRLIESYFGS